MHKQAPPDDCIVPGKDIAQVSGIVPGDTVCANALWGRRDMLMSDLKIDFTIRAGLYQD